MSRANSLICVAAPSESPVPASWGEASHPEVFPIRASTMAEAFNIPVRPHATLGAISFVMFTQFGFGPGDDDVPELPQA